MAANGYDVKFKQQSNSVSTLSFTISDYDFEQVKLNGTDFTQIMFDGNVVTKEAGFAELPFVNANVQLHAVNNVSMEVNPLSYTDIQVDFLMSWG